jgi:hypothetical protein
LYHFLNVLYNFAVDIDGFNYLFEMFGQLCTKGLEGSFGSFSYWDSRCIYPKNEGQLVKL